MEILYWQREVNRDLWRYKLHIRDWYFIIVHRTEGIAIKKIVDHDVERGIITCHSLNDMFRDYKVHLGEVAELYNLIKIVDSKCPIVNKLPLSHISY